MTNVARPEGNVTGSMSRPGGIAALEGRLIQLLVQTIPTVRRVAWVGVQRDLGDAALASQRAAVIAAPASQGVEIVLIISDPLSLDRADHEAWMRQLVSRLSNEGFHGVHFEDFPEFRFQGRYDFWPGLLLKAALPSVTNSASYVTAVSGALLSYGPDTDRLYVDNAKYVDRMLRGTAIADLPFHGPTRWLLTIHKRTAETLGLTIPDHLLLQATEIVE